MDAAEKLDENLEEAGLVRSDGPQSNFLAAVSRACEKRFKTTLPQDKIRIKLVKFLKKNEVVKPNSDTTWRSELSIESTEYLSALEDPDNDTADNIVKQGTASCLRISIAIIKETENELFEPLTPRKPPVTITLALSGRGEFYCTDGSTASIASEIPPNTPPSQDADPQKTAASVPATVSAVDRKIKDDDSAADPVKQDEVSLEVDQPTTSAQSATTASKPRKSFATLASIAVKGQQDSESSSDPAVQQPLDTIKEDSEVPPIHTQSPNGSIVKDAKPESPRKSSILGAFGSVGKKKYDWDDEPTVVEKEIPPDDLFIRIATKLMKYVSTLAFAGLVFLGGVITKSTLLVLGNAYSQDYAKGGSGCPTITKDGQLQYFYTKYMVMLILMSCLCFPEALSLVYSLWRIKKKKKEDLKTLSWSVCFWAMIPEFLHAVGITFLIIKVIPSVDATLASVMLSLVAFIPSLINVVSGRRRGTEAQTSNGQNATTDAEKAESEEYNGEQTENSPRDADIHAVGRTNSICTFVLHIIAAVLMIVGLLASAFVVQKGYNSAKLTATMIISFLLISTRYWENFTPPIRNTVSPGNETSAKTLTQGNVPSDTATSTGFRQNLDQHRFEMTAVYSIVRMCTIVGFSFLIHFVIEGNQSVVYYKNDPVHFKDASVSAKCESMITAFWMTGLTNVLVSFAVYFFGVIACQTKVQIWGFALPLGIATPVVSSLTAAYAVAGAAEGKSLMEYMKLPSPPSYIDEFIGWKTIYDEPIEVAVVATAGFVLGTLGLMLTTAFLWSQENYPMEMPEVLFMKPIYGGPLICEELLLNRRQFKSTSIKSKGNEYRRFIPQIFLCATMWHETEVEMKQFVTSIMRLDNKYGIRKKGKLGNDYFYFEVHIFVDDAIEIIEVKGENKPKKFKLNSYVKQLLELIPIAAGRVNQEREAKDTICETPYGGRIRIYLPNSILLNIHLKDKARIRRKKRWSQCMYMRFLLKYLPKVESENYKRENTFILALDGDIDFQPDAVTSLIDQMKRNPDVGAACGRIHPTGSGPVVWFQKFEYAIGHWLQKSAEDVLGCVLCSPGCFSLFRGEALTDEIISTYSSKSSRARHKIQWDQGEDRWLCTLLLKHGKRIEYCAASDSFTFAPEDFKQFYNQRRRWGPSTMANILDILTHSKRAIRVNENISSAYIAYQAGLLAASLLGASTVVLIVQGAFQYVFNMSAIGSLLTAVIPVIVFVITCYTTSADFQLTFAKVLTLVYALIMMAVLVGVIAQLTESLVNPTSLFMLGMIAIFSFTALIHPRELSCLLHGVMYYMSVPSAMIFLPIYSYCNMDDVSWGTREDPKDKEESKKGDIKSSYSFTIGKWCAFCLKTTTEETEQTEELVAEKEEQKVEPSLSHSITINPFIRNQLKRALEKVRIKHRKDREKYKGLESTSSKGSSENVPPPYFLKDDRGFVEGFSYAKISDTEKDFWDVTIEKHLKPETDEEKEKAKTIIEPELEVLKVKASGAYLFINSMWLVLTFSLTLTIDDVGITLTDKNGNQTVLNPLAFLFLIFYLVILSVQFVTMLIHRWNTFLYLMSITKFLWDKSDEKTTNENGNGTNLEGPSSPRGDPPNSVMEMTEMPSTSAKKA